MSRLLSVVIPTYKRTFSLARLINLVKQQTISKDIEIIVVDQNDSNFLSTAIGDTVLEGVRHIHQDEPNVSLARNTGAQNAQGRYLLFFDDDVLPASDFCEKGIAIMEQNVAVQILSPTLLRKHQTKAQVLPGKINADIYLLSLADKAAHASFFTISACTFFNREVFLRSGGFDPYLFRFAKTAEDQEFLIRLMVKKFKVFVSRSLDILIDEGVPGGCDLRTVDYWVTREKCMKAWAYRHRVHNRQIGKLFIDDIISLCRSSFLNRDLVRTNPRFTIRQIKTLRSAIKQSDVYVQRMLSQKAVTKELDHLTVKSR